MSRIVHISVRNNPALLKIYRDKAAGFIKKIQPSNIVPNKEIVIENDSSFSAVINPTRAVVVDNCNILIGLCYSENPCWQKFGEMPDGNYIIKREDDKSAEFVTDHLATKSLWYYFDDQIFLVSSSQRMIIYLLGDFCMNYQAVQWMLSSGTLGYKNSWDSRVQNVPYATILALNKNQWTLDLKSEPICFRSNKLSLTKNIKSYDQITDEIFSKIQLNDLNSVLALTGGYDSRTNLLFLMKHFPGIELTTFGIKLTENIRNSDLYIAKTLANNYSLKWTMFDTQPKEYDVEDFFNSFVKVGEARIDMLEREIDNFAWKSDVFNKKFDLLINGMEGFSSQYPYSNQKLNLRLTKLNQLKDYENLSPYFLSLGEQSLHEDLFKCENESWPQYYHRIFQSFFIPYADAALNEILNAYVDSVNPLLSKSIINYGRQLPDKQRIKKLISKEIVHRKDDSRIPFSDRSSVQPHYSIIKLEKHSEYFNRYLLEYNNGFFPESTILDVINKTKNYLEPDELYWKVTHRDSVRSLKIRMRKSFPALVHVYTLQKKRRKKLLMDYHILKFRMFLILKMNNIIRNDLLKN